MKTPAYTKYICGLGLSLCIASSVTHAQVPGLGGLNLPGLDLLGGGLLGGLLGGSGGLPGIGGLVNLDPASLQDLLSPATLTNLNPATYTKALEGVTAILSSPQTFIPVPLAPPLAFSFVPGFEVLYTAPEQLLSYIVGGGSILDPSLVAVPAIPILSAPLPGDLSALSGLLASSPEIGGILSPESALSSILVLIP